MPNLRTLLALSLSLLAAPALAAEPGKISIELNDLQQADSGCRAVFVMQNGLKTALDQIVVRVVAFDGGQHATRFLSLELGKLPVGKTRVLRFAGGGMGPGECLAALSLSSRAAAPLDY